MKQVFEESIYLDLIKIILDQDKKIITLVGAGGKTTTLFALGRILLKQGKKVAITTTTKIYKPLPKEHEGIDVISDGIDEKGKLRGVTQDKIDQLAAAYDIVLVEGDGSRHLPLKFPKSHEPVIPKQTDLTLWVAGGMAAGMKIKECCYNSKAVSNFLLKSEEDTINHNDIMSLGFSERCGRKGVPQNSDFAVFITGDNHVIPYFNQLGCMVLAAGESKRMGKHKMLLPFGDATILDQVLNTIRMIGFSENHLILGHKSDHVVKTINHRGFDIHINKQYKQGQSTSLITGIAALSPNCLAVMVFLGDMPLVKSNTIREMIRAHQKHQASGIHPLIIVPVKNEQRGNPVLISKEIFPEINQITGDQGARSLINKYESLTLFLQTEDRGILKDIDTLECYEEIIGGIDE